MTTQIHHVALAKTSLLMSGGERAQLEIIDYINRNQKDTWNTLYTAESGKMTYSKLKDFSQIEYVIIGKYATEKRFGEILAYYMRIPMLFWNLKKFDQSRQHIIFSHDEFLPTILYSYFLKKLNPKAKWVFFFHMKAPDLFKGYEGEFTNTFHFPSIRLLRYWLEQKIAHLLTGQADIVLTVNEYYRSHLEKKYAREKVCVISHYSGVSVPASVYSQKKQYDLVWMGRFHPQKGINELLEIVSLVKREKPDVSVAVIGGGNKKMEALFQKQIRRLQLSKNIKYLGFISGDEKYHILASAKIFLMTSYFESFGQVNLEAMKCGLPVVAYNLPVFGVFTSGMIKVPILDNKKFAEEVLKILTNERVYNSIKHDAEVFASQFLWEKTGKGIVNLLKKVSK